MRKRVMSGLLAGTVGLSMLPGVVFAQSQAYTNSPVNLYAGPADDYPAVSQLPPGAPVTVMGCVSGYTWCDVALPDQRGWVYAGNLSYPYQGSNVPILDYGTVIGLPVVTFSLGAYWGSHYRGRPWYNNQEHWAHHPPPPPGRGGPPPGHGGVPEHGGPGPEHGGPPPGHGGPPPGGEHPPQRNSGQPPGHGGPPQQERGAPPQQHGGPPQQERAAAPQQHGGPPQQEHGGPAQHGAPQEHGGGGGGHEGGHEGGHDEHK
ncbi:SH3 domain-containing protein [Paraburkholderia sp. BCC1885]|uniref:SH3 domain-containing protein n=1 Tax=Paraburkholderia sp. BCC1885 TaxID=2562669 RepID=UPI00118350E7|nr:SH3 domain-containing protein [Paraburkholderia sp. BCC1885]